MASIILHAGMPKAGSSAIQQWLGSLRSHPIPDLTPAVVRIRASGVSVEEHDGGTTNSGILVEEMRRAGGDARRVVHQFISGLSDLASQHERIVLSGEALSQPFWQKDRDFLDALDELAQTHVVVVLYYVRPQDTALEAAWRQWGFRTGFTPKKYVRHRAAQMDYLDTLIAVEGLTSHLDFRMRPFRRDLLTGGDVVVDFAEHGLGVRLSQADSQWNSNVGLELDVVNMLAVAPPGLLGDSPHENRKFSTIKSALTGVAIPMSSRAMQGRELLRGWAHDKFEASNRQLIARLGWETDHFIPTPLDTRGDLAQLDAYWKPRATDAELAAFFGMVRRLVSTPRGQRVIEATDDDAGQELERAQSQLSIEKQRRNLAESQLAAVLDRRAVQAALRAANFVGRLRHLR